MAITYHAGRRIQGARGAEELASTGWTMVSGMTLTSGTGIVVDTTAHDRSVYDLGASGSMTPNDSWVCDFDITRNTGDYNDHPQLMLKSANSTYASPSTNGENQLLLQYAGNGNTGNSSGTIGGWNVKFREGGTNYQAGPVQVNYCQNVGTTLYYRMYMSKTGDGTRYVRKSAWTSDAYRTAEGSTGREIDSVGTTALNSGWSSSDDLRYLIVVNKNNNQANWTLSNFKFWNGVVSSGVADNMLSHTPTINLNFTDGYAGDTKPTNVQVGSRWEETDTRKMYHYESPSVTYETDFSTTTNWTKTGTAQDITGGELAMQAQQGHGIQAEVYDLGTALSDSAWTIKFKIHCTSFTTSGAPSAVLIMGMSSISTGNNLTAQDFIGCRIETSASLTPALRTQDTDGASIPDTWDASSSYAFAAADTRYIQLTRLTSTSFSIKIYSDSTYSTLVETVTGVCASGITGLRYFSVEGYSGGSANSSTFVGEMDDLKIYNGVTSTDKVWSEEGT